MTEESVLTPAYLWFDSEFTSLDVEQAHLLQVALMVTDSKLNRLTAPGRDLNLCIKLGPDVPVSAWVAENLAALIAKCRSESAVSLEEADRRLATLVDEAVGPMSKDIKRRPVLAGNTVHMDAALARKLLPQFTKRLHYRFLDVSTLKVLWNDWFPGQAFGKAEPEVVRRNLPAGIALPGSGEHDAYYDIHASVAELNYYRQKLLTCSVC